MLKKIFRKIRHELQFSNTQYYTRLSDKVFKTYYQLKLKKAIKSLSPIALESESAQLTFSILANRKNFYESLATLYSFCYRERNLILHYHEDGTLTDEDIAQIKTLFPDAVIFRRLDQDKKVTEYLTLKGLINCAQLRGHFIFSLRLFDMIIEKQTPYLLQIDSDVLIFDNPMEILEVINTGNFNGCFNQDVGNFYTFNPDTIAKYIPVPVIDKINAGLLLHNFDEAFFDFVEHILANEVWAVNSWHLEQSLFAVYASFKGNFSPLPISYDVGRRERSLGNKLISEHYCHNTGYSMHQDFIYKLYPQYKKSQLG